MGRGGEVRISCNSHQIPLTSNCHPERSRRVESETLFPFSFPNLHPETCNLQPDGRRPLQSNPQLQHKPH